MTRAGRELQVQLLLDDLRPALVALSETELKREDLITFNNYKVFFPSSTVKGLFRLLLLVREDYAAKYNPTMIRNSTSEIWIKLDAPCGSIAICSLYRQWTGNEEEEDLNKIDDAIRTIAAEYDRLLILGDVNLDAARMGDNSYYRRKLLNLHMECIRECGLELANELDPQPTFYSYGTFEDNSGTVSQKSSTLDHVYYRGLPPPDFTVLPTAITDHRPTLSRFNLHHKSSGLKMTRRRNFKSISTPAICCTINATALSRVFGMEDVDEIHTVIIDEINAALDIVAPMEDVKIKDRNNPLYLSNDTRAAIRERDRAAERGDHAEYRRLRNKAARMVKRDKMESNVLHLQKQGFNSKAIWNLANHTTGRSTRSTLPKELINEATGSTITGDANLANCVNEFYITKIDRIRERIRGSLEEQQQQQQQQQQWQQQQGRQQQQQQQRSRFRFRAPSEGEVLKAIMGLNNTPAIGVDGIPVSVLKQLAPVIAAPVAHLIKKSFEYSAVPDGFKKASVVPLHKKNKPMNLASSYRPVSILAALSKVLERVVLQQVSPHLAGLLPPEQFGFRPRRSTAAAIAFAHGSWAAARAEGKIVAVAGYDLSSAFDTIDVGMVSNKLNGFGVRGEENRWFYNYLSKRQQQVRYNNSRSTFKDVKYGVPQGSILGPLLFLVLVADLPDRIIGTSGTPSTGSNTGVKVGFSAYADDALCWVEGDTAEEVGAQLERVSAAFVDYANKNYLAINENKTQVLWTAKGRPIKVGSSVVPPSDKLEVLGIKFDKHLSPNPHLTDLITSAKAMTAMARRLSLHLPANYLKIVMGALIRGKIGYGCLVFPPRLSADDPNPSLMSQLQVNINNVARATIGAKKSDKIHVEDLLAEAGFPSLNKLVVYTIAMECWRALNLRDVPNGPLNPLGSLLKNNEASVTNTRTRAAKTGCLPPPAKYQVDSFTWWGYTCWNSSPPLRAATTVTAAKKAANEFIESVPF